MNRPAVFPSNVVARWIDAEWLERDPLRDQPHAVAGRHADLEIVRRYFLPRPARLRYRPFECLSLLRFDLAS